MSVTVNDFHQDLLASIGAVQCLRTFLDLEADVTAACGAALRIEKRNGELDNALYWEKQKNVIARMKGHAEQALVAIPSQDSLRGFLSISDKESLLSALGAARECLQDIVSHHGDFDTACKMTATLLIAPGVESVLVENLRIRSALEELKFVADAALASSPFFKELTGAAVRG